MHTGSYHLPLAGAKEVEHSSLPGSPDCILWNGLKDELDTLSTLRCHAHLSIMTDSDYPNSRLPWSPTITKDLGAKCEPVGADLSEVTHPYPRHSQPKG